MVDLGQAIAAQDRRDSVSRLPWPSPEERALRNRAIETDSESDWQAWRAMRDARVGHGRAF